MTLLQAHEGQVHQGLTRYFFSNKVIKRALVSAD